MDNIHELCFLTQGKENNHRKEELYQLTFDEDDRVASMPCMPCRIST